MYHGRPLGSRARQKTDYGTNSFSTFSAIGNILIFVKTCKPESLEFQFLKDADKTDALLQNLNEL